MVLNGIIKEYPKVPLKDFRGDISYTGGTLKLKKKGQKAREPTPGGGDVRRAIVEYCILPMSKDKTTQGYIVSIHLYDRVRNKKDMRLVYLAERQDFPNEFACSIPYRIIMYNPENSYVLTVTKHLCELGIPTTDFRSFSATRNELGIMSSTQNS